MTFANEKQATDKANTLADTSEAMSLAIHKAISEFPTPDGFSDSDMIATMITAMSTTYASAMETTATISSPRLKKLASGLAERIVVPAIEKLDEATAKVADKLNGDGNDFSLSSVRT